MKKRFFVHLMSKRRDDESYIYSCNISLEAGSIVETDKCFSDEEELKNAIRPLLSDNGDAHNVLSFIQREEGYQCFGDLTEDEAAALGWKQSWSK
jgi:hypothetical protein